MREQPKHRNRGVRGRRVRGLGYGIRRRERCETSTNNFSVQCYEYNNDGDEKKKTHFPHTSFLSRL